MDNVFPSILAQIVKRLTVIMKPVTLQDEKA